MLALPPNSIAIPVRAKFVRMILILEDAAARINRKPLDARKESRRVRQFSEETRYREDAMTVAESATVHRCKARKRWF